MAASFPDNTELASAEELYNQGTRLMSAGDPLQAESFLRQAIALEPGLAPAHTNLALLLEQKGLLAEAEHHYLQAIDCDPDRGTAHLNLGVLLAVQKRFVEAEAAYGRALELTPDSSVVWTNLGVLQACRKQEQEAEESYLKAIELDPNHRLAYFNLSYLLLRQGRFEEGWRCLEARDWYAHFEKEMQCPRWRGEPLQGKSLLIGFEGGHGDMIQLCRYAAVLKARGAARITLICHPALKTLFSALESVDALYAYDEQIPVLDWDFWTPPFSIAYYCQTRIDSIPADIPYLRVDDRLISKWSAAISCASPASNLRVGLVWKGNPCFENDADRSLPHLNTLEPLGAIPGVSFFALQKGAGEDEAANPPAGLPLVNLGAQIADFADTAAIVANLDVIICVDTAIAHLAGALGKECWLLLPDFKADWRWLTERLDSPWYPVGMRLFRQTAGGCWAEVVERLRQALQQLVAAPRPDFPAQEARHA
jgi:Tfp pilus assembly protein PilF